MDEQSKKKENFLKFKSDKYLYIFIFGFGWSFFVLFLRFYELVFLGLLAAVVYGIYSEIKQNDTIGKKILGAFVAFFLSIFLYSLGERIAVFVLVKFIFRH
jgi:hypothetical protein